MRRNTATAAALNSTRSLWTLPLLSVVCPLAFAAMPIPVAVLPFSNLTGETNEDHWSYTIPFFLKSQLREIKGIRIPSDRSCEFEPDASVEFAYNELGYNKGRRLGPAEAFKLGQTIGARSIVFGTYSKRAGDCILVLQVVDTSTGEAGGPWTLSAHDWLAAISETRRRVLRQLGFKPAAHETARMQRLPTRCPQAFRYFSCALAKRADGAPLASVTELLFGSASLDPQFGAAQQALASILQVQGRSQEALEHAKQAVAIRPDSAGAHYVLGTAYLFKDLFEDARAELLTAARLDPSEPYTYLRLAEMFGAQEKWDNAVGEFKRAEELAPFDAKIHAELGRTYSLVRRRQDAVAQLKRAERYDTRTDVGLNLALGEAYALLEDLPQAVKNYGTFIAGAEKVGLDSPIVQRERSALAALQARLTTHFVTARHPRHFKPDGLANTLSEMLKPEEFALVTNPLTITPEIAKCAEHLGGGGSGDLSRARRLFDGLTREIRLRHVISHPENTCPTAEEAFTRWSAPNESLNCQDLTSLYVVMGRHLGLDAYWVAVKRDCRGLLTCHACAGVFVGEKALLVDPSYIWFGAPHEDYDFLDDLQVTALHLSQQSGGTKRTAAVVIAPHLAIAHFNLAELLSQQGKRLEAREQLDAGLRVNTEPWLGFYARALVESHESNWTKASDHLQACLELNPEYGKARLLFASTLSAQGKLREACHQYQAYLEGETTVHERTIAQEGLSKINENLKRRKPHGPDAPRS
jgi:tetratricopeptide (TPR) repeat protein